MKKIIASSLGILVAGIITMNANSHEGNGFKHLTGRSGPIVEQRRCPGSITMWGIDNNEDGIIDVCKAMIFAHDMFHVKEFTPVEGKNSYGETVITCDCDLLK